MRSNPDSGFVPIVRFGVHLPLIGWPDRRAPAVDPLSFAERAEALGFATIAANDHLVYPRPWLDGPSALMAAAARTSTIGLMTTVALPVVRGPFALAKTLAAIDVISGGRLTAAIGLGSSRADYALVGIPFGERWARFEETAETLRSLLRWEAPPFVGRFYSTDGIALEPRTTRSTGVPLWIGSWGSKAGLARVARYADGWLASAYNTTPAEFAAARRTLDALSDEQGRARLPARLATGFMALTGDTAAARRILEDRVAPMLRRPVDELAQRLLVGPDSLVLDRLAAYAAEGVEQVLVWPVVDELVQVERFAERIKPNFE